MTDLQSKPALGQLDRIERLLRTILAELRGGQIKDVCMHGVSLDTPCEACRRHDAKTR